MDFWFHSCNLDVSIPEIENSGMSHMKAIPIHQNCGRKSFKNAQNYMLLDFRRLRGFVYSRFPGRHKKYNDNLYPYLKVRFTES